jgi:hypothetical protein
MIVLARLMLLAPFLLATACTKPPGKQTPSYEDLPSWQAADYRTYDWSHVHKYDELPHRYSKIGRKADGSTCIPNGMTSIYGDVTDGEVVHLARLVSEVTLGDEIALIAIVGRTAYVETFSLCFAGFNLHLAQNDRKEWILKRSGDWIS